MKSLAAIAASALALANIPATATAKVTHQSEQGFSTSDSTTVAASPDEVWRVLVDPARYWNPDHSWTLDGANFTLDPRAGGCFCEAIPAKDGKGVGSVEHMRVIYADPGKMLRMQGALGPLQSEALNGVLTVKLAAAGESGTTITWEYVVSGFARYDLAVIAPAVDGVQTEQLNRLAARFSE